LNVAALIFAATITFSPFAGIIAYIITYDEYKRHVDKKEAKRHALETGIFSFLVFIAVGLIAGFGFNQIVSH
jgi:Na+/proline symporter